MSKGVYCLTFPNGKKYVGIGCGVSRNATIENRWSNYRTLKCKDQPKLYNALVKYGSNNIKYEIILETDDIDNAKRSEMYLIDVWNLQDDEFGYNLTQGGDGNCIKRTPEQIERNRNARLGYYRRLKEQGLKPPRTGKKHSEETKRVLSEQHKGMKYSSETNAKKGLKGELNPFYGKRLSEETKRKISETKKLRNG